MIEFDKVKPELLHNEYWMLSQDRIRIDKVMKVGNRDTVNWKYSLTERPWSRA